MRHHDTAICLRTTDFSETSQVLHLLTRGCGVVHVLGKGTKRPKSKSGGAIDLLAEGDVVFISSARGGLGTLVEFTESVAHADLRKDLWRLNTALYMIELAGLLLAESDPHPEVFDLLHNALVRLGQADAPLPAVLAYFQWRLLRHVGLMGELTQCISCGRQIAGGAPLAGDLYFSSRQGGLLCPACEGGAPEKYRLDPLVLGALAALAAAQPGIRSALGDKQAHALNRLLAYHVGQQLGKTPRMARHVMPSQS